MLIAGYTPLCFNILIGWVRLAILVVIWLLARCGVSKSLFTLSLPRWMTTLYIEMGWVVALVVLAFLSVLPWTAVATLIFDEVLDLEGSALS